MKKRILTVLLALALLGALAACGKKTEQPSPAPAEETPETAAVETPALEPGTLLESGTGLNENYYAKLNLPGRDLAEMTDSSVTLEPASLGTDEVPVTVRYDENTRVTIGKLWYYEDRYEIYAATLEDLKQLGEDPLYLWGAELEDPDAEEPYALELRLETFMDLG